MQVDGDFTVGHSRTFRTNCNNLWLLPSPDLQEVLGERGRRMNRNEKSRFCGIVPESIAPYLNEEEFHRAIGNCIPVGMIGLCLYPVLKSWCVHESKNSYGAQSEEDRSSRDP